MEQEFNKLDEFLRHKVGMAEYEVNEVHWESVLQKLNDPEDGRKKRGGFWLFLAALIFLTSALSYGVYHFKRKNNDERSVQHSPHHHHTALSAKEKEESSPDIQKPTIHKDQLQAEDSGNTNPATHIVHTKHGNNQANTSSEDAHQSMNRPETSPSLPTHPMDQAPSGPTENDALSANQKITPNTNKGAVPVKMPDEDIGISRVAKPVNGKRNKKSDQQNKERIADHKTDSAPKKIDAINHKKPGNIPTNVNAGISSRNSSSTVKKPRIYKSAEEYIALNPRYVKGLENYTYTIDQIPLSKETSDSIRLLAESEENPEMPPNDLAPAGNPVFKPSPTTLFLLAGLSGSRGYMGNMGLSSPSWGFMPYLGVGYQKEINQHWQVALMVYYTYLRNLNISNHIYQVRYGFGVDSLEMNVQRKSISQLHIPLMIGYRLNPQNTLKAGVGINIALGTKSDVKDFGSDISKSTWGYNEGISPFDFSILLGYERQIRERLTIQFLLEQGLFDNTSNTYFNNQTKDLNSRFLLGLKYNIYNFK